MNIRQNRWDDMKANQEQDRLQQWLAITNIQTDITNELERSLQQYYHISVREFYVLYFLSQANDKKLRLQQLQEMVGLSQSAMSRLVSRFEAKTCGVLQRYICEADRRGVYTSITVKGEEKLQGCMRVVDQILQNAFTKDGLLQVLQAMNNK